MAEAQRRPHCRVKQNSTVLASRPSAPPGSQRLQLREMTPAWGETAPSQISNLDGVSAAPRRAVCCSSLHIRLLALLAPLESYNSSGRDTGNQRKCTAQD